jgi:hypothetical protein
MEIWKTIEGFENYQVSNLGNVKSKQPNKKERILKFRVGKFGYLRVMLQDKIIKKEALVHRLVATAFIPNVEKKAQVNHINSIKSDNRVDNLEWNTREENMQHSYSSGRNKKAKAVSRYNLNEIKNYKTIKEAGLDNNISTASIHQCLRGKSKTCNGYKWKYI